MSTQGQIAAQPGAVSVVELLEDVEGLVSPPDVCLKMFELIQSPTSGADDIAGLVSVDPNLTTRVLRLANSAFYRFRRKIDTVSRAVTVIGTAELYQLVLSISAVKSFSGIANELVRMETFWRHSVYTGLMARALAIRANVLHPERLFVAGMMHDIGALVLYHQRPHVMQELLLIADGDEQLLYTAEMDRFGFSHATVAARLMENWQLPDELIDAIAWHHAPGQAAGNGIEARILYLAEHMVNASEQGNFMGTPKEETHMPGAMLEEVEVSEDELFFAFEEAAGQFPATLEALTV
ncbi:MAG TPA: HDOD domain-containing protein [Gammaproteobacteria bacterium]|nr:HDOD domain-containing protein [Gammaproteobacteria bacterium]